MLLLQVFLISLLSGLSSLTTEAPTIHDFHYCRIELNWTASTSTWQATTRVFTDDIEAAIQAANLTAPEHRTTLESPDRENLNFGDPTEHPETNQWIATYIDLNCLAFIGTPIENPIEWNFIGKEVELDLTYLYFESQPIPPYQRLTLTATLFFEIFEDQVNEVTFQAPNSQLREWLIPEAPRTTFDWQP